MGEPIEAAAKLALADEGGDDADVEEEGDRNDIIIIDVPA
jgi:hypothetical protein